MFDNIKRGNYYEVTRRVENKNNVSPSEDYPFGYIIVHLDSESKHIESSVNHVLEVIGTIGGSFELIHYSILILYATLRKNLYFHTIINRIHDYQRFQNRLNIKVSKSKHRMTRTADLKAATPEKSRLFEQHEDSKHEINSNSQAQTSKSK